MLKEFCRVLLGGVVICYSGAFLLFMLVSGLSRWLDGRIFNSDLAFVLMMSLPALFWGLWQGRPVARPRVKVARFALVFIAIVITSLMDMHNTRLMLLASLGVWSFGMLGMHFGRKLTF